MVNITTESWKVGKSESWKVGKSRPPSGIGISSPSESQSESRKVGRQEVVFCDLYNS